jgi:hypothetical protein
MGSAARGVRPGFPLQRGFADAGKISSHDDRLVSIHSLKDDPLHNRGATGRRGTGPTSKVVSMVRAQGFERPRNHDVLLAEFENAVWVVSDGRPCRVTLERNTTFAREVVTLIY